MIKKKSISRYYIKILEKVKSGAGFTLVELIVVLSVAAVISVIGIAAFVSYNQTQSLNTAAANIANMFSLAKSRAASGVKPTSCSTTQTLDGYEIRLCGFTPACINLTSASYELDVRCNGSAVYPPILTGKLPSNITFTSANPTTFTFPVLTGGFSGSGQIVLSGFGKSKTITVDSLGNAR